MIKLKNMKVSIVIPVFNEKNNIGLLVDKIKKHLKSFTHEIIVVDDSSFDGTVKVLKKIEKRNKNLKVIYRDEIIRDLSKSCRDGFEKTKYKNIIVMDGDLQHDPKYLPKMIKLYRKGKFDFIIGVRDLINVRVRSLSLFRQSASFLLIKVFDIFLGKKTLDPMSGFFLFKKKIYIKNKKKLYLKGFKILADLIYAEKNFKVKDLVIKFNYRTKGKSKLSLKVLFQLVQFIIFKILKIL